MKAKLVSIFQWIAQGQKNIGYAIKHAQNQQHKNNISFVLLAKNSGIFARSKQDYARYKEYCHYCPR